VFHETSKCLLSVTNYHHQNKINIIKTKFPEQIHTQKLTDPVYRHMLQSPQYIAINPPQIPARNRKHNYIVFFSQKKKEDVLTKFLLLPYYVRSQL